ncbi:ABC transporter permease [Galbitalea sp. SE-J8]|uniref:ABC transporter permease n=1 Tax=Galbitalea sp. SE-J8 TaxID=3054952 RepID=UPI00259C72BD|nr:ABC transporter permease [Galbitalea sp. SE-J8]MDM4762275.1 ABC transporter permease [Galbitalea sp. SE-J8]
MTTRYVPPTFWPGVRLVAERELSTRLRSKSFLISSAILLAAVLVSVVVGSIASANPSRTTLAVAGPITASIPSGAFDVTEVTDAAAAEQLVRSGDVDAAVVPDDSAAGVRVIALDETPADVVAAFSIRPDVQLLDATAADPAIAYFVALGFGVAFFMAAITFGQTIAQSVVEEKQNRVVEILMATTPARVLLAGKILGNSILAFAQIALIAAVAGVGLVATGQDALLAGIGPSIVWFVILFVFGFVMLAALYSATAALVSRQEDLASAVSPVTMLVMIPYFLIVFFNQNDTVVAIMSYVPFSAPIGMPVRIFLGTAQWWEPLVALAVLIATTVGIVAVGSRVYAGGLLRTGGRVKVREALRG